MACDLTKGRVEQCKDAVAGLDAVYFANFVLAPSDVTYDVTNTDLITDINNITNVYKYELKGANSFSEKVVTSRENGTTYWEQSLTIQLKKQDIATHKQMKLLAYARPHVIVRTKAHQYFIMGLEYGSDVTDGSFEKGQAMGDFNGYKMTLTAMERIPANFLDCTTDTSLATVLSSATIVTS